VIDFIKHTAKDMNNIKWLLIILESHQYNFQFSLNNEIQNQTVSSLTATLTPQY